MDRINFIVSILNVIVVAMILALIMWGMSACAAEEPKCPKTVIEATDWNHNDQLAFNRAQFVCSFKYKEAVCLVRFKKLSSTNYHAICGRKR